MGHEFCGEVHELGEGVSGFAIGERVASLPWITCGECERCARGEGIIADATAASGSDSCRAAMRNS